MPAKPNPERDQRIRDLVAKGLSNEVIGARLGMRTASVTDARKRLGLSNNRQSPWVERV